jgi:hypothetical protein
MPLFAHAVLNVLEDIFHEEVNNTSLNKSKGPSEQDEQ